MENKNWKLVHIRTFEDEIIDSNYFKLKRFDDNGDFRDSMEMSPESLKSLKNLLRQDDEKLNL